MQRLSRLAIWLMAFSLCAALPAFAALPGTLPPAQTTWSALDGFIHAVEAFLARRATPLTDTFARLAAPAIARALPRVLADGEELATREELALGCLYPVVAKQGTLRLATSYATGLFQLDWPAVGGYHPWWSPAPGPWKA